MLIIFVCDEQRSGRTVTEGKEEKVHPLLATNRTALGISAHSNPVLIHILHLFL